MASFASSATTGGARKHAWTKNGSKLDHHYSTILSIPVVGEKQKKRKKKKIGENNGELRFRPPPRLAHASRLDQKFGCLGLGLGLGWVVVGLGLGWGWFGVGVGVVLCCVGVGLGLVWGWFAVGVGLELALTHRFFPQGRVWQLFF